jgi:hypothetical protein
MFYFWINASIVWNINVNIFSKFASKFKKQVFLRLKFNYSSVTVILSAILLRSVLSRVVYANNIQPHVPRGTCGGTFSKGTQARSLIDDVRRDIAINFMLACHKLSFLIGQFEVEHIFTDPTIGF